MDAEIARLHKLAEERVRTGGKGTQRRKQQVTHKSTTSVDDKKLHVKLANLGVKPIGAVEEANFFKADGNIIHFKNPSIQTASKTFVISGKNETKPMASIPHVIAQLGAENLNQIKKMADAFSAAKNANTDDIPDLVSFDSKQ
ncbi:hypothetical protein ACTA71_008418 [Dictyostelium dimigraforme]